MPSSYHVLRQGRSLICFPSGFPAANYPKWLDSAWVAANCAEAGCGVPVESAGEWVKRAK